MKAIEVYNYINDYAPFSIQDKFDNAGFLVGDKQQEITKICICLDITNEVVEEAKAKGANLIVSHHPVIFNPLKQVLKGSPVYLMIENGISAICAHTNLDMCKGGITDIMLKLLKMESKEVLHIIHPETGIGYGKIVDLAEPKSVEELAEKARKAFNTTALRYTDCSRKISRLAVCSGAGDSEIYTAAEKGCDCIITGDIKRSGFVDGYNMGISVIDAGHFHTENIICEDLLNRFKNDLKADVFIAENSTALYKSM